MTELLQHGQIFEGPHDNTLLARIHRLVVANEIFPARAGGGHLKIPRGWTHAQARCLRLIVEITPTISIAGGRNVGHGTPPGLIAAIWDQLSTWPVYQPYPPHLFFEHVGDTWQPAQAPYPPRPGSIRLEIGLTPTQLQPWEPTP